MKRKNRTRTWRAALGATSVLGASIVAVGATGPDPAAAADGTVIVYSYNEWTVPDGVTSINVELLGGHGGRGGNTYQVTDHYGGNGGRGRRFVGDIAVEPGDLVTIVAGKGGAPGNDHDKDDGGSGGAGHGDGAPGGTGASAGATDVGRHGGGGGGASLLIVDGVVMMSAAGGGGGGGAGFPGHGGAGGDADRTGHEGATPIVVDGIWIGGGGVPGVGCASTLWGTPGGDAPGSLAGGGGGGGGGGHGGGVGGGGGAASGGGGGAGGCSYVDPAVTNLVTSYHEGGDGIGVIRFNQQETTITTVTDASGPVSLGNDVAFTVAVTMLAGTEGPAGTVELFVGTESVGTQTRAAGDGSLTFTVPGLDVGTHAARAVFTPDAPNDFADSEGTSSATVTKGQATIEVTSAPDPSLVDDTVTFTATVAPVAPATDTPTGTVTFTIGGVPQPPVALDGATATLTTSTLASGTHDVEATYDGDDRFLAAGPATDTQTVGLGPTALALSITDGDDDADGSTQVGEAVTVTAQVTGLVEGRTTPTGTVRFVVDGTETLVDVDADGRAELVLADLAVGDHEIAAAYLGDLRWLGAETDALAHVVTAAPTTTTTSTSTTAAPTTTSTVAVSGAGRSATSAPPVESRSGGALARTGADLTLPVAVGGTLVVAGAALTVSARRRRTA